MTARPSVPGIYDDVPMAEYQADTLCPGPSLSASIAHLLLSSSPWHAWAAHPRLGNSAPPQESERLDLGTIAHAYLLEGVRHFEVLPEQFTDWRRAAAKSLRDAARKAGKVPVLADKWDEVCAMVAAARTQLEHIEPPTPFEEFRGRPEETLLWQEEGGVYCRARLDWLHGDHRSIDDYKTTSATANPDVLARSLWANGWDVKAAWYLRAVRTVLGTEPRFRYIVQENYPPYALSVVALSPAALELAERKVERAITLWRTCLAEGVWPGYPQQTAYADPPPWEIARWEQQAAVAQSGEDEEFKQLFGGPSTP